MEKSDFFSDGFTLPDYPSRVFRRLDNSWLWLEDLGEHIFLPKNSTLVEVGDEINYCYQVVSGRVISLEYTPEGTMHIFYIFEKGSIFLESNLLTDTPAAISFQTLEATELLRIDKESLYRSMRDNPEISLFLLKSMSYKYYSAMDQVRENYNHSASWRVYNLLSLMASNFGAPRGDDWVKIGFKLSQQMIGDLLGMNRTTVCNIIKELKDSETLEIVNGYYCIRK